MDFFEDDTVKRRWRAKDTMFSRWHDFPGVYTAAEVWAMLREGRFAAIAPVEEAPQEADPGDHST